MNVKGIIARVGFSQFIPFQSNAGVSDSFKNLSYSGNEFQPGVDLGLQWDVRKAFPDVWWRPRLGIVGRNINNPKFSQPSEAQNYQAANGISNPVHYASKYSLQGQSRAGLAISPLSMWHISADIDVTNNLTPVHGYKSRYYGLGTEFDIFNSSWLNIPLRAGFTKNIAANDSFTWTGGFGFNFFHVIFDLAGMVSHQTTTIQDQGDNKKVPNNVGFSAQFALLFGGDDSSSAESSQPAKAQ
jgi:hypothetical protein